MYKLPKELQETLINYLDNSNLPHRDVKQLVEALSKLEKIKE